MDIQDKVAIVTGASRGIGAQIARELAKRGAHLFITWTPSERSRLSALEVIHDIKSANNTTKIEGIAVDLALAESPAQIVEACLKHFSHIDILVNNAGIDSLGLFTETTIDSYQRVMDVNLRAPYFLIQAVLPHLRRPGRIINISSIAARTGFTMAMPYSMSKAGLEAMTRSMARDFGADGTTVNAVAPGIVESDMTAKWSAEDIAGETRAIPVQHRIGTQDDIAQIVAWLASEGSRWVSGQTISASGGQVLF